MAPNPPTPTEVTVLWDYENAYEEEWSHNPTTLFSFKENVEKSLKHHKQHFVVKGRILAFGPDEGQKFNVIQQNQQLMNDIEVKPIPRANMRCDPCGHQIVHARESNQELIQRKTDIADKYIALEMFNQVLQGFPHILVISGDSGNFHSTIEELNKMGSYIMLAIKNVSDDADKCAKAMWPWSRLLRGGPSHH